MHSIKLWYVLILLAVLPGMALAQIEKFEPVAKTSVTKTSNLSARLNATPVELPFWDDFSTAEGHQANPLNWLVSNTVFVNDGQAINPPSINVATFDGYNEAGVPYSNIPEETGYGDVLESQPILLGVPDDAESPGVPIDQRTNIYLSFFYQAGGNGEMPNPSDFLKLEFKDKNNVWREIARFTIKSNANPATFYDTAIQIPQPLVEAPDYFHNEFQFRFTSFGRLSGSYDAWHLDYVYLNERVDDDPATSNVDEEDRNTNISDRTTTKPFTTLFTDGYFSMPRKHFDEEKHLTKPLVSLYSLKYASFGAAGQVVSYSSYFTITHYKDSIPTTTFDGNLETLIQFEPLQMLTHSTQPIELLPETSTFAAPDADSTKVYVKVLIDGGDNKPADDYYDRYIPIEFRSNDTLEHTFILSNYYAYDDGVAEYSAGLAAQGNQLAYRFVIPEGTPDAECVLNGAYIYFPFTRSTVPPNMQLFIFNDKAGKPDSASIYSLTVPVTRTANSLFSEITFTKGVQVRDTFYIGYLETQTGGSDHIRIGLDTSHDTGQHLYYRTTVYHQWQPNDKVVGNFMIRPRFGEAIPIVTGTEEGQLNPVSIYPNPSRGEFYMKGPVSEVQIITMTGQPVNFSLENLQENKKITLQGAAPGLYIVRYRSGTKVFADKILVTGY